MVNKLTLPAKENAVQEKINELVDDKQDTLVSGTNIKTVGGISILGSGDIAFPTIDSALSTSSTNAVQNKVITSALNGKLDGYNISVSGAWTGGAHAVNFITVDYSTADNNNGVYIKTSMVSAHGNGVNGKFFQDVILSVNYTGTVAGTIYRYFAENVEYSDSSFYGHKWGDVFWTIDTENKIVKFYVLIRQYSYAFETPYFRLNSSTGGTITQYSGTSTEYSEGMQTWATVNWFDTDQTFSATSPRPQSGIALNNAKFLRNLSANNTSLSIFGNGASSFTGNAINIGYSSTAINSGDIAIGRGSNARGSVSIALGFDATVSNNCSNAIQLGTGTNSTANTFNVGFRNVNNYRLLDGTTGIIPYQRINAITDSNDSDQVKVWTGTKNQYDALVTNWYAWTNNGTVYYTASATPSVGDTIYDSNKQDSGFTVSAVGSGTIEFADTRTITWSPYGSALLFTVTINGQVTPSDTPVSCEVGSTVTIVYAGSDVLISVTDSSNTDCIPNGIKSNYSTGYTGTDTFTMPNSNITFTVAGTPE